LQNAQKRANLPSPFDIKMLKSYVLIAHHPTRILRSSFSANPLQVPHTNLTFGSCSFHVAAPTMTNRFTALEASQNEVTPEDLWNTKTVLLEVAREMIGSVKSQKKKKWISDDTQQSGKREKQKAKIRIDIKN